MLLNLFTYFSVTGGSKVVFLNCKESVWEAAWRREAERKMSQSSFEVFQIKVEKNLRRTVAEKSGHQTLWWDRPEKS